MKLKEWRKKRKLSQEELAAALEGFAREQPGGEFKKLRQTTLGYWERGTLPRKWWLNVIKDYTRNQVTAGDFALTENTVAKNATRPAALHHGA